MPENGSMQERTDRTDKQRPPKRQPSEDGQRPGEASEQRPPKSTPPEEGSEKPQPKPSE